MALLRRFAPVIVSVGLVVGLGALAFAASAGADHKARAIHRQDREILQTTLAGLGHQYVLFALKEEYDVASAGTWALQSAAPADTARLREFVGRSPIFNYGAAVVDLQGNPLSAYAADPAGLPAPTDPGFAPLKAGLLGGKPGLSSVIRVGNVPVVGLGVPVMVGGVPRAVMVAFWRADRSPLQTYTEQLRYGRTGKGYLVDSQGGIIAGGSRDQVGTKLDEPAAIAALANGKKGFNEVDHHGTRTAVAYSPLGEGSWGSITTQSASEFFGPISKGRQHIDLSLAALLVVAAAGLAMFNYKRQRASRRENHLVRLMESLAAAANEAGTLEDALAICIERVCTQSGWVVGHAYVRPEGSDELVSTPIWHLDDPARYEAFRQATDAIHVASEVGLPGRVLAESHPAWIADILKDRSFPRAESARNAGLRAAFALPVLSDDTVVAVLEFFADRPVAPDRVLLEVMRQAATQLAHVVEREQAEEALRRSWKRFRSLVQNGYDVVTVADANGAITYDSPAIQRVLGYGPEERLGHNGLEYVHPDDQARARDVVVRAIETPRVLFTTEFRSAHRNGGWRWFEVGVTNLLDDPSVGGMVANQRDITERKAFQEQLTHQAYHDALTGLPNRSLFQSRLEMALARANRHRRTIAVLFLDLDRFKVINDSLGHETGDDLLVAVAHRLQAAVRGEDTVARMSGDEFTVLLEEVEDEADAARVARRMIDDIRQPVDLGGHQVFVGASIGIALSHEGEDRAEDLLRDADLAMYRAKERGRSRYEVFETTMGARARQRLDLEADLRRALEHDELRLHYQPEVDLSTGRVVATEALVRWEHPERGLLAPIEFIPMSEETGLILPLGRLVLEEACRQAREWQIRYPVDPPRRMSVNVSGRQLPTLVHDVEQALTRTGLDPSMLTLEITESVVMEEPEAAIPIFRALRGLGVELAIDDFGTGYSSLSYLKHFPISELKLDKSFVDGLGIDAADRAIAQSVVTLASCLHVTVTAEGIETPEQAAELVAMGCPQGQGFNFARPQPPEAIEHVLERSTVLG